MKQYYVYIMTNKSRTLYTGVTGDLERRVYEHRQKLVPGFTAKYRIAQLVYFEVTQDIQVALVREKQIKGWLRAKKIALIESVNPKWEDLSPAGTGSEMLRPPRLHRGELSMTEDRPPVILSAAKNLAFSDGRYSGKQTP